MDISKHIVTADKFKSMCLGIIKDVYETGLPVIITKQGIPMVKIIPYSNETKTKKRLFAALKVQ